MQSASLSAPLFTRLASAAFALSQRHWRFVLIAMLALLHVAVFRGAGDPWARALLLAHLGLLLLWQPFLRAEQPVSALQGLALVVLALALLFWPGWWLLAFWVVVLAGLVGGKVYQQHARWQRRCCLVVLLYLLALLTVVILPELAPGPDVDPQIRTLAEYGLPAAFALIAVFPAEPESGEGGHIVDLFYSIFLMLLLGVVVLGSFTFMALGPTPYLEALTYTVFLVAGTLLLIALAWDPRAGFAGLRVFFSRYLFSIGLPIERWLHLLAELHQLEGRPQRFLVEALDALAKLPGVAGAAWRTAEGSGEAGAPTAHCVEYANSALALRIYSRYRMSPALHWHLHLLGQVLGEFYLAKQREEGLRQASYLQAVHETGARTTHDIKNLLQSLNVLCSAAASDQGDSPQLQALLRRQLPVLAQRLADTLEKLQRPRIAGEVLVPAAWWWDQVVRRHAGEQVAFELAAPLQEARLPQTLFDSVADNLIRNALAKRARAGTLEVRVSFLADSGIQFRVRDSGRAIAPEIASTLLRSPVPSREGLGIGLHQAAKLAQASGYSLTLETNREGEVCFLLSGPAR
jgi:signal transduction histidine kinase